MIVTTTPSIEGKPIREYLGIVVGEAILGAKAFKDFGASIRDVIGGRASGYEKDLIKARETALAEMQQEAETRGANAVLGVDIDYETLRGTMLMVTACGTAVKVD
jgi:uncharacterized protein YbjQ (UPF0145 family)